MAAAGSRSAMEAAAPDGAPVPPDRSPAGKTVVMVHGLWVTRASWDAFRLPWEAAGWTVHAPTWPVLEGLDTQTARRQPPTALGVTPAAEVVEGFARFVRGLPAPPLLLGHSFGGLFIQMLLDRGLGRAGIAVNPAPIAGVRPGLSAILAAAPALLRWRGWARPYALTRRRWAEQYANTAPANVQATTYDAFVIPTSGRLIHQAALGLGVGVNPTRRRQPLLITGSSHDRLITPGMARGAFRRQRRSSARTDYLCFPDLSHLLLVEPGWESVAEALIAWADEAWTETEAGADPRADV